MPSGYPALGGLRGRAWEPEEIAILSEAHQRGVKPKAIQIEGRSVAAIKVRMAKLKDQLNDNSDGRKATRCPPSESMRWFNVMQRRGSRALLEAIERAGLRPA